MKRLVLLAWFAWACAACTDVHVVSLGNKDVGEDGAADGGGLGGDDAAMTGGAGAAGTAGDHMGGGGGEAGEGPDEEANERAADGGKKMESE